MAKRDLVLAVGSGADTPAPKGSSMEIAPVYAHADGTTYIHASGKVYFLTLPASSVSLTVGQFYRFTPRSPEGAAITAQITAGAGDMLFKDLVPVDPATLLPSADPGPAWFTALTGKQDTATLAADTAAHVSDGSALDVAVAAKIALLKQWAANPDTIIAGVITRDANGAATSAPVVWPNGQPGTYTADTVSTAFPGAVDAYHITYGSPVTKTFTQPTVTRDASGAVTTRPALVVT